MERQPAKVLRPTDVRRLLNHVTKQRYPERSTVMILLSFKAGLRACEISGLKWPMVLGSHGRIDRQINIAKGIAKLGSGRRIWLETIRRLNDRLRSRLTGGQIVVTRGVQALDQNELAGLIDRMRNFQQFDQSNDPHGEHDFGSLMSGTQKIFWKIDYYDNSLTMGSPDPADESVTTRMLTIMLASEY